jgi:hypothetical protein
MTELDLSYLSSNQPNSGGISVSVTSTTLVASFNYIIFPGQNAAGTEYENQFLNGTINVGSENCALISSGASYIYHLFITTAETLCADDYFLVVSGLSLDGSQTPFQSTPLTIPLTPSSLVLADGSALIEREFISPTDTQVTITVLCEPLSCVNIDDQVTYQMAIQYTDDAGEWNFLTINNLTYDSYISTGGIETTFTATNGCDDCYVAVQGVRSVGGSTGPKAIGALSNTVMVQDSNVPQPPTDFEVVYTYNAIPATAAMTWNAPASAGFTDVTSFVVYRSINGGPAVAIENVPYVPGTTAYAYTDDVSIGSLFQSGDEVTYYVVSVNPNGESVPSDSVTITIIAVSSPPLNLSLVGLKEGENLANLIIGFQNPSYVEGDVTSGYETAYFTLRIYGVTAGAADTLLETREIEYNSELTTAYEVAANDLPFYVGGYNVVVFLNTFNPNDGTLIVGQSATGFTTAGPSPLFFRFNDDQDNWENWNSSNPLTSVVVISYSILIFPQGLITSVLNDVVTTQPLSAVSTLSVTSVPDFPYEPFAGAYVYTYSNIVLPASDVAITLSAANPFGLSSRTIVGPYIPQP